MKQNGELNENLFNQDIPKKKTIKKETGKSRDFEKANSSIKDGEVKCKTLNCFVVEIARKNLSKSPDGISPNRKNITKILNSNSNRFIKSEKPSDSLKTPFFCLKNDSLKYKNKSEDRMTSAKGIYHSSKIGSVFDRKKFKSKSNNIRIDRFANSKLFNNGIFSQIKKAPNGNGMKPSLSLKANLPKTVEETMTTISCNQKFVTEEDNATLQNANLFKKPTRNILEHRKSNPRIGTLMKNTSQEIEDRSKKNS